MIRIEDVAVVTPLGMAPPYSRAGYCITPDGTTYTLLRSYWHGAVLALLFPKEAQEAGYVMPEAPDEVDVREFQQFELDNHNYFPVIRVCPGRLLGPVSVDRGSQPSTPAQLEAMRQVVAALGLSAQSEVSTDHSDMTIAEMHVMLAGDLDAWSGEPREVRPRRLVKKGEDPYAVREAELDEALAAHPEAFVAVRPAEDDGFGEGHPLSFEAREGVTSRKGVRGDE